MSQDEGSSDEVGSVGEEAAKLLGALSEWAKGHVGEVDDHLDTGAPACTYCPICKTVHVLRQASPEVRNQLTTAASALIQAAAGLMATPAPGDRGATRVQNIDLDDDSVDWPEDTDPDEPEEGDR